MKLKEPRYILLLRKQNSSYFHCSAKELSMDQGKIKLSRYCVSNFKGSIYDVNFLALGQNLVNQIQREVKQIL